MIRYRREVLDAQVGDVAQLGERGVRNAEVRGSIPLISTNLRLGILCRVHSIIDLRPLHNVPFCPISASGSNFNPRNIQYIPVVKIFAFLELEQN